MIICQNIYPLWWIGKSTETTCTARIKESLASYSYVRTRSKALHCFLCHLTAHSKNLTAKPQTVSLLITIPFVSALYLLDVISKKKVPGKGPQMKLLAFYLLDTILKNVPGKGPRMKLLAFYLLGTILKNVPGKGPQMKLLAFYLLDTISKNVPGKGPQMKLLAFYILDTISKNVPVKGPRMELLTFYLLDTISKNVPVKGPRMELLTFYLLDTISKIVPGKGPPWNSPCLTFEFHPETFLQEVECQMNHYLLLHCLGDVSYKNLPQPQNMYWNMFIYDRLVR